MLKCCMCGIEREEETLYQIVGEDEWYCKSCFEDTYGPLSDLDSDVVMTDERDIESDQYEDDIFDIDEEIDRDYSTDIDDFDDIEDNFDEEVDDDF